MGAEKEFEIEKEKNFSEWFHKVLEKAELIDDRYNIKGFYVLRPWLMEMVDRLYQIWEEELKRRGHKKVLFPTLIPEENFEREKEHVAGFKPEVFWVTEAGDKKLERRLALRPTSETAFYSLFPFWIRSYKDLPLKLFQSCSVFRFETKATKPLIRLREFLWIEAHDAFASEEEALQQVREDMEITKSVYSKLGIPFLFFKRPSWDKFKGAVFTFAADTLLPDGKRLQLPSTHYLGQNFAKAFDIKFSDKDEEEKYVYQTCYGPPISRTLAAIISLFGDSKGLRLPFEIAPLQVVIVPIPKKGREEEIIRFCREVKERLKKKFRVEMDESEKSAGEKFNLWELKGVPIRLEIGEKELETKEITLARRDTKERVKVRLEELEGEIERIGKEISENLKREAEEWFRSRIFEAESLEELKEKVRRGFVRIPFCSIDDDGKECGEKIKEICDIAGSLYPEEERPEGKKCLVCGREAKVWVYACRSY